MNTSTAKSGLGAKQQPCVCGSSDVENRVMPRAAAMDKLAAKTMTAKPEVANLQKILSTTDALRLMGVLDRASEEQLSPPTAQRSAPAAPQVNGNGPSTEVAWEYADNLSPQVQVSLGGKTVSIGLLDGATPEDAQEVGAMFEDLYATSDLFKNMIDSLAEEDLPIALTENSTSNVLGTATVGNAQGMALNMIPEVMDNPDELRKLIAHEVAHWVGADEPQARAVEGRV